MAEGSEDDGQDKSNAPTQRKLEKSREQGDVPVSTEITMAATYAAIFVAVLVAGGSVSIDLATILKGFLARPEDIARNLTAPEAPNYLFSLVLSLFGALAPVFGLLALATTCSLLAQRAVTFAPSKIKPKLSRLSPVDNAKQKYGPNGLGEFVKSAVKMLSIMVILGVAFRVRFMELPYLALLPVQSFGHMMFRESAYFIGLVTMAAVIIAAVDLPWKRYRHEKKLMMSYEELKKENKETEGDPHMKGERRKRAQEIATNQMMMDVPDANVVVVNPTHYAVALKWDRDEGGAPVVVAKGVDAIAARIREAASEAGVPIHRDPPTARSLHALVEIGEEIHKEHYKAVAAAIHYADTIRERAKAGFNA